MNSRHSKLALVLICVDIDGTPHLLFHRHRKWGDWSLVGGHVEPGEEADWQSTATREAEEELAPLRANADFIVEPLPTAPIEWGPVPSRSKGNAPTTYSVRYYTLRFLHDAATSLCRLDPREFVLVQLEDLEAPTPKFSMSDTFERFAASLGRRLRELPRSWPSPTRSAVLPATLERFAHVDPSASRAPQAAAR